MKKRTVTLPKKRYTLAGKLVDSNFWGIGDDLAQAVIDDWDALNDAYMSIAGEGTPEKFGCLMSELPALKKVAQDHHLDPFYVAMTIINSYL
jgi:hypothetical protein